MTMSQKSGWGVNTYADKIQGVKCVTANYFFGFHVVFKNGPMLKHLISNVMERGQRYVIRLEFWFRFVQICPFLAPKGA